MQQHLLHAHVNHGKEKIVTDTSVTSGWCIFDRVTLQSRQQTAREEYGNYHKRQETVIPPIPLTK